MLRLTSNGLIAHIKKRISLPQFNSFFSFLLFHFFVVPLEVLPASELFKHDHLVLPLFGCLLKQLSFLFFLRQIDDVSPTLLILLFEILEELIEALIPLRHALDRLIE